jgi:haloacetate dehalogenase
VALRLALDHPGAVSRLAVLDIVPTRTIYETVDQQHGSTVWRYFFLTKPAGLPEHMIAADPDWYLRWTLREWCGTRDALADPAVAEYARCFTPAMIHASCEDYRAGATIDLAHDRADGDVPLSCPALALWSEAGLGTAYNVPGIWGKRARDLRGRALDCGHFLAEERPDETAAELLGFCADEAA